MHFSQASWKTNRLRRKTTFAVNILLQLGQMLRRFHELGRAGAIACITYYLGMATKRQATATLQRAFEFVLSQVIFTTLSSS
ncbi:hypothetical protein ARMGADRAFT_1012583 [Armillaria gallica]|uniref:Uncharacterized protein n=1 Tax=Armillaria gallica TaxID=47427 RepID=A0A2H3DFE9_ARMGA|nr:hypothetical protein ARMGADRAFT_1012583 [Armillaria gallica]